MSPCGNLNENGPDGPKGVALLGPVALLEQVWPCQRKDVTGVNSLGSRGEGA